MLCQVAGWHAQIAFVFLEEVAIRQHSPNIQLPIKTFNDSAEQNLHKVDEAAYKCERIESHEKMSPYKSSAIIVSV